MISTWKPSSELRGSAAVASPEPRLIATGPVRLLHVSSDRRTAVTLFSVPQRSGTAADCRAPYAQTAVLQWDREGDLGDLKVRKGELICASSTSKRRTLVSWHAQPDTSDLANGVEQASAR